MAADLFVVPTVTFRLLFVLVILAHDRRQIVHVAVTEHPTAAWTAQQLRNPFSEIEAPRHLLHDRDSVFADVAITIAGMNTQAVRTAPRSLWQNAYVERSLVRSGASAIVMNSAGLRRLLRVTSRTTWGREPISRLTRTPRARARSHHRQSVASSPFLKSVDDTTATTASPRSVAPRRSSCSRPCSVGSTRVCCGDVLAMSTISRALVVCTARTYTRWEASKWRVLSTFQLFSRYSHPSSAVKSIWSGNTR
jgi:hypothetical protein